MAGDKTEEIMTVLEVLADLIDTIDPDCVDDFSDEEWEHVTAVWQIIELTQLLLDEHGALQRQMHEFIGTLRMAEQANQRVAESATQTIIANAGDAKRFIQEDDDVH